MFSSLAIVCMFNNHGLLFRYFLMFPRVNVPGRRKMEPVSIVILAVIMSLASVQVITRSIESIVEFITYDLDCHVHEVIQNETIPYCGTKSELHSLFENCINGATGPIVELPTLIICSLTIGENALIIILFHFCFTPHHCPAP